MGPIHRDLSEVVVSDLDIRSFNNGLNVIGYDDALLTAQESVSIEADLDVLGCTL